MAVKGLLHRRNTKENLMRPTIIIVSDHAGFDTKVGLIKYLKGKEYKIVDLGTNSADSVDYPDFGHKLGESIESGKLWNKTVKTFWVSKIP